VRVRGPVAAALTAALLAAGPWLTACSGSSSGSGPGSGSAGASGSATALSATELVAKARTTLDGTSSVHFVLTSADVPAGVSALLGGEGDAVRPDRFAGALDVNVAGARAKVSVVSLGGKLYAKLPFSAKYEVTDPAAFHVPDPGAFMSPTTGVTQLLATATGAASAGTSRAGGTVLQNVTAQLPGQVVGRILVSADPSQPVRATFGIDPATGQLLTATLVGPFFARSSVSTFTLALSRYGEPADIRVPTA